jgi:parvulin-like peptidyl-prolyl isomerase
MNPLLATIDPIWADAIYPAIAVIFFVLMGFIWFTFDKRYVKKEELATVVKNRDAFCKRQEDSLLSQQEAIKMASKQAAEGVAKLAQERFNENHDRINNAIVDIATLKKSREESDIRTQNQLSSIAEGVNIMKGQMSLMLAMYTTKERDRSA